MSSTQLPHDPAELLAHSRWMRSLARSLVADSAAADDLVQETWLAFMKRPPRNPGAARAWLARVLRNFAFRRRRSEVHQLRRERLAARPEATISGPEEIVERAEMHHKVVELVLALKEPYRSTVLYHFFDGLSPPEIARSEGIPVTTVRSRIAKALADLRSGLDQAHGGDRRAWSLALLPLAGWTVGDLAAAPVAGTLSGGCAAAPNFTLGGVLMTAKKTAIALLASLLLFLGLGSLYVAFHGQTREDGAVATPQVEVAAVGAPPAAQPKTDAQASVAAVPASAVPPEEEAAAAPSLVGTVTDTDGKPVAGARVTVIDAQAWSEPLVGIEERYSGPHTGIPALQRAYSALASQAASMRTAADGTYSFHGLRAGEYRVLVSHPEHLVSSDSLAAISEGETARCDVEIAPGAALWGRVVDEEGTPVPGALVACESSRSAGARGTAKAARLLATFSQGGPLLQAESTKSGEDGAFSFRSLEPMPYDVKATRDGFATSRLRNVEPGEPAVTLVLRRGTTVAGRALAPNGSLLSGVELELRQSLSGKYGKYGKYELYEFDFVGEKTRWGSTDQDGRFSLEGVEAGSYDLIARAKGFPHYKRELRVDREPVDVGDLRLEAPASIAGRVLSPAGASLEAARVWAQRPTLPGEARAGEIEVLAETVSGAGGLFSLTELPPGRFEVLASGDSGLRGAAREVEARGEPIIIQMNEGIAVSGVCVDAGGAPVEGARVSLESGEASTVTAADGAFDLRGLPREALSRGGLRLRATHPEYHSVTRRLSSQPEGKVELRFAAAAGPRGIVLDQEGKPVPRARVCAEVPGVPTAIFAINPIHRSSIWSRHTDDQGFFCLAVARNENLAGVSLEIAATHARYGAGRVSMPFGSGDEWPEVEIVLAPALGLEGHVTDSAGRPVARARVEARRAVSATLPRELRDISRFLPPPKGSVAYTGNDGSYRLPSLAAGSYEVEVSALGYARKIVDAVQIASAGTRADVALDAGGSVSGRVVSDAGQPIAGAEVQALLERETAGEDGEPGKLGGERLAMALGSGDASVSSTRSLADGRFRLTRLPEGTVTLVAQAAGFQPALVEGAASDGPTPDLVLVRSARLTGRAVDGRTGLPLTRYQLRIEGKEAWSPSALSPPRDFERTFEAADGGFLWEDLAPGAYDLELSSPDHPPFRERVVLRPGTEVFVDARLEEGARLEGVVRVRGVNSAVPEALVELRPAGTAREARSKVRMVGVETGKEGEFAFSGLDPGDYDLSVRHPDFYLDEGEERLLLALPRDAAPLEIYVRPAGRLSGRLRARRPLDPKPGQFWFGLVRLADAADDAVSSPESRPRAADSPAARGGPTALASDFAYRKRVEADGSLKASGLKPGRYRLELHEGSRRFPAKPVPREAAAGNDETPPLATLEIEVRAGGTTDVELEVP